MRVTLNQLSKHFGPVKAVDNLNLEIGEGEFMALLGPSGCGKTTTLLTIAGFYKPTAGEVRFNERVVNELPPRKRNIGMVFQSYALYPHMKVLDNIAFPLKVQKAPRHIWQERARKVAELLEIDDLLDRLPGQLSGGQQQRVALARALVREPDLLLLDEPLSNLDAKLRVTMRAELKRLQKDLAITTIFVTHDQVEAMTMADRIALLEAGRLQQVGAPEELYHSPVNLFVAGFIGTPPMNFLKAKITEEGELTGEGFRLSLRKEMRGHIAGRRVEVIIGVRPEHVTIGTGETEGEVYVVEPLGRDVLVTLKVGSATLKALTRPEETPKAGERVKLNLLGGKLHLFDTETGQALLKERNEG